MLLLRALASILSQPLTENLNVTIIRECVNMLNTKTDCSIIYSCTYLIVFSTFLQKSQQGRNKVENSFVQVRIPTAHDNTIFSKEISLLRVYSINITSKCLIWLSKIFLPAFSE